MASARVQVNTNLSPELYAQLDEHCKRHGLVKGHFIRDAIAQHIKDDTRAREGGKKKKLKKRPITSK